MPPVAKTTTPAPKPAVRPGGIEIRSIDDVANLANLMFRGGCQPPGIDRPEKLAVIILAGLDVGLSPTQAVGSIMLTGGKTAIYGDGALALVRASGLLNGIIEDVVGTGDDRRGVCTVGRKGEPDRTFEFTMAQAKQAKLIERAAGKGPWVTYPDRMLLMRARGYALRDVFPDVLRGLITYEEAADMLPVEVGQVQTDRPALPPAVASNQNQQAALPTSTANEPTTQVSTGPITEEQITEIRRLLGLAIAARGITTDDEKKALVVEVLQPFAAKVAKDLTAEQGATLIKQLGEKHDPFTYGPKQAG